jgi:hypothetical protein
MRNFTLTEKQYADLNHILMCDNADLADHPQFFEETASDPYADFDTKKYIDDRIELCKAFEIDFWESASAFSHPYNIRRLKAIYGGQSIKEFEEKHERATGIESFNDLINTYEEQKGSPITAFDIFTDTELPLLAVKCTAQNAEFQRLLLTLPEDEKESFLSKYRFVFIFRHGKEKEEELIAQFLTEYRNRGFGLCKN